MDTNSKPIGERTGYVDLTSPRSNQSSGMHPSSPGACTHVSCDDVNNVILERDRLREEVKKLRTVIERIDGQLSRIDKADLTTAESHIIKMTSAALKEAE